MRTPLLPPERRGGEVEQARDVRDLAPTLLEAVRVGKPRGMHGCSQLPAVLDAAAPPPREYAYASCGLQQGGAVFGEHHTYEYTKVGSRAMNRSWFGDDQDHQDFGLHLFYDRDATPFPWVAGRWEEPPREVKEALQKAGANWDFDLQRTRKILQGGTLFYDPRKDAATIAELREKGFLGDGF